MSTSATLLATPDIEMALGYVHLMLTTVAMLGVLLPTRCRPSLLAF
jgi:hypothetical protein